MRIYVAGRWKEKDRIREVQRMLRLDNHTITFDWTEMGDTDDPDELQRNAMIDLEGVRSAEAVVVLPAIGGKGMWVEMGAALALRIPIFVVGTMKRGVFEYHPLVTSLISLDQLLTALRRR